MCYPLVVLDRPLAYFPLSCEASTPATAPRTSTTTALLVKLCVEEFAKSHSWQCNYEASAESKTASVIRKQCGNEQDPGRYAECLVPFPLHRARDVAERPPSVPLPMRSDGPQEQAASGLPPSRHLHAVRGLRGIDSSRCGILTVLAFAAIRISRTEGLPWSASLRAASHGTCPH